MVLDKEKYDEQKRVVEVEATTCNNRYPMG